MKEKLKLKLDAKSVIKGVVFIAGVITSIDQVASGVNGLKEKGKELKSNKMGEQ